MNNSLCFKNRKEFRSWLEKNCQTSDGIWLIFRKTKDLKTLKANEALEEALCFGWIDGVMKKIDDMSYTKYFAPRRKYSKWSVKNKDLVIKLEAKGVMTDFGRIKIDEAKKNGQWDKATKPSDITNQQIEMIADLLKDNILAYNNFVNMSPSIKKTYTRAYLDAKTETGRQNRLKWMLERLENNLKPM